MHPHRRDHPPDFLPAMGHDRLLGLYDPFVKLLGVESVHRALIAQADLRSDQRILEIGCGTGNLVLLAKRLYPDVEVVGIDPDPKALARAQRKARRAALSVRLDRGYAQALPYADASFDRVLSALMFHHLTADVQVDALQEVRRVLLPGGTLHLLDFGGAYQPSRSFLARMHRSENRLPELLRGAGFVKVTEHALRKARLYGRLTSYSAMAPSAALG